MTLKTIKKEGATSVCKTCGSTIICRMTSYKNFPNKLQWQNDSGTAHYDRDGNCKGFVPDVDGSAGPDPAAAQKKAAQEQAEQAENAAIFKNTKPQTSAPEPELAFGLTEIQESTVRDEFYIIMSIKKAIIAEAKSANLQLVDQEVGMITKLIYENIFAGRKPFPKP